MKMFVKIGGARARLLASTLLAGAAALAAPAALVLMAAPTAASAQDYTSGTLVGTVVDSAGAPVAGAKVVVKSLSQGVERTLTSDSAGQFRAALIQVGAYSVAISKDDYQPTSDGNVKVGLGGSTGYTFTLNKADAVAEVVVTATANPQIDFAATTTGRVINVEDLTKQMPIARTITALTLLAPGVVTGSSSDDAKFNGLPSVGGSSVAENAYYINGLNITDFNTYLGSAPVPFDFYKTVEVKTGGYPAEFGRATGGVINAVTKSGGNDFHVALHGNWEPSGLHDTAPNTFERQNSIAHDEDKSFITEVSGPIIQDHLFFYVLNQQQDVVSKYARSDLGTYTTDKTNDPFWGAKLDGYITDRQHVELTWFDTTQTTNRTTRDYDVDSGIGDVAGTQLVRNGGVNWVAKYTGSFTDWFTLSGAYGKSDNNQSVLPSDTSTSYVLDYRDDPSNPTRLGSQPYSTATNLKTSREFYRIDADFYFDLLGKHHVRTGYDHEKLSLMHTLSANGGAIFAYYTAGAGNALGLAEGTEYARVTTEVLGGQSSGVNKAYYLQDSWDVTDRLNLQLGVRNDSFATTDLTGAPFITLNNNWAPRIGFNLDLTGDRKSKLFGSYGRYFIPPALNAGFRTNDYYFRSYFLLSGVDATTGQPTLGSQITAANYATKYAQACPGGSYATAGALGCTVYGDGEADPSDTKFATNLKPTSEDEFILGYERQFNSLWKGSVTLTYRTLNQVSEDVAVDQAVQSWCTRNGISGCADIWSGYDQYVVLNPGKTTTFKLYSALPGETSQRTITLSADELGYPKARREYVALQFAFDRAFDGKWGLSGSYTLSQSKGNYEGTVNSDIGQEDAGTTVDFDLQGLTDNSFGLLPNHHGHQFKLNGSYAVTDNLMVGANYSLTSPKHYGCLGVHPTDVYAAGYGAVAFYCNGVAVPRGSKFTTDWVNKIDLSVRYTVPTTLVPAGDLVLRADVFNLFNAQSVTTAWEYGEDDEGNADTNYGKPTGYQTPRYVRLGFDLSF
jgi:outer membrane receptor protein involved in Fe transport